MRTRFHLFLTALQLVCVSGTVFVTWQIHENRVKMDVLDKQHKANEQKPCVPYHEGMTLEPGQCTTVPFELQIAPPADAGFENQQHL